MKIVVLGMHRSGTSVLTGIIGELGFFVGVEDELLDAQKDNPKGFYERKDIVDANNKLLRDNNLEWFLPTGINNLKTGIEDFKTSSSEIINKLQSEQSNFVIKDPRLCILFKYWEDLLPSEETKIIIINRNPFEIAQSLLKRNKIDLHHSIALWEFYQNTAISSTQNYQRLVVNYDDLLTNPEQEYHRIIEFLEIKEDSTNTQSSFTKKINSNFRNSQYTDDDLNYWLNPYQLELYNSLRNHKIPSQNSGDLENQLLPSLEKVYRKKEAFNEKEKAEKKELERMFKKVQSSQLLLQNILESTFNEFDSTTKSFRWKIGDKVVNGIRALSLKPKTENYHVMQINSAKQRFRNLVNRENSVRTSSAPYRINIITPTTNIHGGTKRLITIAHKLKQLGYDIKLLRQFPSRELDWYQTDVPVVNCYFNSETPLAELERMVPNGDILINYGNNTASHLIDQLSPNKGKKFNLFMHFGIHDEALDILNAKLENSIPISTTQWIAKQVDQYSEKKTESIGFGVHLDQFTAKGKEKNDAEFTIGSLYHNDTWKHSQDVIKAYEILRLQHPEINARLVLFGQEEHPDIPESATYFLNPEQSQIESIYHDCDVWVTASEFEGIGMCSVEAMLCKTALITTKNGGNEEFCNDKNCTFVATQNPEDIADKVFSLYSNRDLLVTQREQAYTDILQFKWSNSIHRLEKIFLKELNVLSESNYDYDLSIGIPIHNQFDFVTQCIDSVFKNTSCNYQIVLIDDNSDEETYNYLKELSNKHSHVKLIRNKPNKGFPHNCNLILTNSSAPYICLLNSDTIVTKNWQEGLIHNLRRLPSAYMSGPSTSYGVAKNYDQVAQQLEQVFYQRFDMSVEDVENFAIKNKEDHFNTYEETEYLNGFCMMLKTDVVRKIGFFDTQFGMGSREEVQYIDRIKKEKGTVVWAKDCYVHHYGHRSFNLYEEESKDLWEKNKQLYHSQKNQKHRVFLPSSNVLFVYNAKFASSTRKRTFEFQKALGQFINTDAIHWPKLTENHFKSNQIIILQRIGGLNEEIAPSFIQDLQRLKEKYPETKLCYDTDDLILRCQNELPLKLIQLCDLVICTTPTLQNVLKQHHENVEIIQNGIDLEKFSPQNKEQKNKIVSCFSLAGAGFNEFVKLENEISKIHPELSFHFYCSLDMYDELSAMCPPRISLHKQVEFEEMIMLLKKSQYVINYSDHTDEYFDKLKKVYNLEDDEKQLFINSKSGLKYYNAAVTENIFLTNNEPVCYSELIKDGENGFICTNVKDFVKAITKLEQDSSLKKVITNNAYEDVISKYSLNTIVIDYLDLLQKTEES